jgi:uncharacterized protein (TIGR02117 family)
MRRLIKRAVWCVAALAGILVLVIMVTARPGDPAKYSAKATSPRTEIFLVSHGYHSGIVIPRVAMATLAGERGEGALIAVATRFRAYPWIEFGWGEEEFYRNVPTAASLTFGLALRALLRPGNASVLHVVGLSAPPLESFPQSDVVALELSEPGLESVLDKINGTFGGSSSAGVPEDLGPGLYGPSLFFRANGSFNIFHVCNHWVADVLDAGGVPTSPILALHPAGLLLDLRWRTGLAPLTRPNG